jgi:hypothetical protein
MVSTKITSDRRGKWFVLPLYLLLSIVGNVAYKMVEAEWQSLH